MIAPIVAAGIAYILLRTPKAKYPHSMYDCATGEEYTANTEAEHQAFADLGYVHKMSECPMPESPDVIDPADYPDTLEEVWSNDDGLVKVWKVGIAMGRNAVYEYHYQVGNADGSSFVSESQAGNTNPRIVRFSTKQKAIDYILDKTDEEPSRPGEPEVQPDDEDEAPSQPTLPTRPGNDLGGMGGYTNLSGGGF